MPARKSPPAKPPGRNVEEWERGTSRLTIRCSAELVAKARHAAESRGCTLADVLRAGVEETMRLPKVPLESTLTAHLREQAEAAELRADYRGED